MVDAIMGRFKWIITVCFIVILGNLFSACSNVKNEVGNTTYIEDTMQVEDVVDTEISFNEEREISQLLIVDENQNTEYELKEKKVPEKTITELSERQMACLKAELQRTGVTTETVKERYHVNRLETMSEDIYRKVMYALARTQSQQAA